MKQKRPFQVVLSSKFKRGLIEDAKKFGAHYGVFFTTSGQARVERINPNAQYNYIFRTDTPELIED